MSNMAVYLLDSYFGAALCMVLDIFHCCTSWLGRKNGRAETRKIVFVKFMEQGALVLHRAAFALAVKKYGKENVFLCTFRSNRALVRALQVLDEKNIIALDDTSLFNFALSYWSALGRLRKEKVDSAVDLEFFSRATAAFCYMSGAKYRAGYHRYLGSQTYRGNLFTHRLHYSHYAHVSETSVALLHSLQAEPHNLPALDIEETPGDEPFLFQPKAADVLRVKAGITGNNSYSHFIILNPNFNDPLPLRQWAPDNYPLIVRSIQQQFPNACFIFTGRADEHEPTDKFIAAHALTNTRNMCGKTDITDLLTLYSISQLLVCSDSGPGHFASITSVSTIVLFGPETPVLYAPKSPHTHIIYKAIACSPCYNVYNNRLSSCTNNICMKKITAEEVIEVCLSILEKY